MIKFFLKLITSWGCNKGCKVVADCDSSCKNGKCSKLIVFLLLCSFSVFSQQGNKGEWVDKKPVTIESLTKDATIYDTLTDGNKVYYKKTKKGEDYYFVVTTNKKGILARKRVFLK